MNVILFRSVPILADISQKGSHTPKGPSSRRLCLSNDSDFFFLKKSDARL